MIFMPTSKRFVGLDVTRGFGIMVMLLIHAMIQQIGDYDDSIFIPHVKSMHPVALILLAPLVLLGLWGTAFPLIASITISVQMLDLSKTHPDRLGKYVLGRFFTGFILIVLNQIAMTLFEARFFKEGKFFLPEFNIRYGSNIIDAIAFTGVITSFCLYIYLIIRKKIDKKKQNLEIVIFFLVLIIIWFVFTPFLIPIGRQVYSWADEHSMFFLKYIVSKFVLGRFTLFPVVGFGFLGMIYGLFLHNEYSFKKIFIFSLILTIVCVIIFLIFLFIDSSFFNDFASLNAPIQLQILNLGLIPHLILAFSRGPDFSPVEIRHKRASRTTWMRRYSIISLTAFSIATYIGEWIFHFFTEIWGSSIDRSGEIPIISWNFFQIAAFLITVMAFWELLVRLWEKIDYKGSLEWFMIVILSKIVQRKSSKLNVEKILYEPNKPLVVEEEEL